MFNIDDLHTILRKRYYPCDVIVKVTTDIDNYYTYRILVYITVPNTPSISGETLKFAASPPESMGLSETAILGIVVDSLVSVIDVHPKIKDLSKWSNVGAVNGQILMANENYSADYWLDKLAQKPLNNQYKHENVYGKSYAKDWLYDDINKYDNAGFLKQPKNNPEEYSNSGKELKQLLPDLEKKVSYPCPCKDTVDANYENTIARIIIHLNDTCGWDRLDIADWLEQLDDVDLTFKNKIAD